MVNETVIAVLRASLSDDGSIIRQLISLYAKDSPRLLTDAAAALDRQDAAMLKRAAHSLKSTSSSMGATTAAEAAAELEQLSVQNDLAQAAPALQRLKLEVNTAIAELSRMTFGA